MLLESEAWGRGRVSARWDLAVIVALCFELDCPSLLLPAAGQPAMIFDPSTSDHLKPWLIKTLEPMSVLSSLLHLVHLVDFATSLDAMLTHPRWPTTSSHC